MTHIFPTEFASRSAERWYPFDGARLFGAYRDRDQLLRWFGPPNLRRWLRFDHDLRPGGALAFGLMTSDGHEFWGRCDFIRVEPGRRIEYVSSITDPSGEVASPLPDIDWLLRVHTIVSMIASGGGTILRVDVRPHEADHQEQAFFAFKWPEMQSRFAASFSILDALLKQSGPFAQNPLRPD